MCLRIVLIKQPPDQIDNIEKLSANKVYHLKKSLSIFSCFEIS